jgi:hypothetical protein
MVRPHVAHAAKIPFNRKFTLWEGGTLVRSFIWSPDPSLVPGGRPGSKYGGLLHATDVYQTFLAWAGIELPDASGPTGGGTGPIPFDGFDQSYALQSGLSNASLRNEVLHAPLCVVRPPPSPRTHTHTHVRVQAQGNTCTNSALLREQSVRSDPDLIVGLIRTVDVAVKEVLL